MFPAHAKTSTKAFSNLHVQNSTITPRKNVFAYNFLLVKHFIGPLLHVLVSDAQIVIGDTQHIIGAAGPPPNEIEAIIFCPEA